MTGDYVDVRRFLPGYTTIPCRECDSEIIVHAGVVNITDDWYHDSCRPDELKGVSRSHRVRVRL